MPVPTAGQLKKFCEPRHIVKLAVYGSRLRDDFGPVSDVDLLVKFGAEASVWLLARVQVADEISPLFGGRRIDLFTADSLSHYIRDRIIAEAEQLYPHPAPAKQPPLAVDDDTPLRLMREQAREAIAKTAGKTRQELDEDRLLRDLVCFAVDRLGLPAKRVSKAARRELAGCSCYA